MMANGVTGGDLRPDRRSARKRNCAADAGRTSPSRIARPKPSAPCPSSVDWAVVEGQDEPRPAAPAFLDRSSGRQPSPVRRSRPFRTRPARRVPRDAATAGTGAGATARRRATRAVRFIGAQKRVLGARIWAGPAGHLIAWNLRDRRPRRQSKIRADGLADEDGTLRPDFIEAVEQAIAAAA